MRYVCLFVWVVGAWSVWKTLAGCVFVCVCVCLGLCVGWVVLWVVCVCACVCDIKEVEVVVAVMW